MKTERNAPCPCSSGKKYKRCCGAAASGKKGPLLSPRNAPEGGRTCNFACRMDCSEWCCTGATVITVEEFKKCFDVFPITVGFRKYAPVSPGHKDFLNAVGMESGEHYIVGDFIAGNWRRKRCMALNHDNLCGLHREGRKPLQCLIVPFCALYPEDKQDAVFAGQKTNKFARCSGFKAGDEAGLAVWRDGKFTDGTYRDAFYLFRKGLERQKPFMQGILEGLKEQNVYRDFLKGEGILETFIPMSLLFDVLEAGGLPVEDYYSFLKEQIRLCSDELSQEKAPGRVFEDYLEELRKIAGLYAKFVKKRQAGAQG